ncbi:amidohydrolase family protein [Paenibacillus sp. EKM202P]|uniref:amidohydrolase n=1 Tax=unclassified Paenibacillus TaxID=185978 RepID=UPI0013ED731B|nr:MULTISPECIES: amidohydrolase family protein [unclassified Paenibacillus]KAF6562425.1 amidohydrolase family protein [Paenibacillus sp. EKM202P]KAF6567247.1 amidohydrolase family protein [Paenibacillus sp. EKM207P]
MQGKNDILADKVLLSNAIFNGLENEASPGFVAVRGERIAAVGCLEEAHVWIGVETVVYDLGDAFIMPGIHDNHVFFTGYMSMHRGVDLTHTASSEEAVQLLLQEANHLPSGKDVTAYGWSEEKWGGLPEPSLLDGLFPDRAVIAINQNKSYCWMNRLAEERYQFSPDQCSAEARALLLQAMMQDRSLVQQEFMEFCRLLAARGVTSIKDIGFDRHSELLPILEELKETGELPLRFHFSLEPVVEPFDISIGIKYKALYHGDLIRFQGYKLMLDGVVADHTGDMLEPYADMPGVTNLRAVDYEKIEASVLEADSQGIKCCLTAEGDAAIRQAVSMIEKCRAQQGNHLIRHSISDLEYPHPDDLTRMGENEIFAEVYAQILLLNPSYEEAYMSAVAGKENENRFYNYKSMLEANVPITIGTDLPLFITSVPDSLYAASHRLFPDGSPAGGWYPDQGMPASEVLKAWTINGARHCYMEEVTGTLEAGKYADIAVFDRDLLNASAGDIRDAQVILTIMGGKVTYNHSWNEG